MRLVRLLFGAVLLAPLPVWLHRHGAHAAGPEFLPPSSQLSDQRAQMNPILFSGGMARRSWSETKSISHLLPPLERLPLLSLAQGAKTPQLPTLSTKFAGKFAALNENNQFVFFTVRPAMQSALEEVVSQVQAPHVAAVIMDPETGKVLAISGRSSSVKNIEVHSGFPAASLFKIVTAAAAVEEARISSDSVVRFRGGNYTLNKWNYLPKSSQDNRTMSVGVAMGKSCNPVFGRLALNHVGPQKLREYAESFGFNNNFEIDIPLPESSASIPSNAYELSRTGAGFGDVRISPIHAAALVAGVTQDGKMPQPTLIDKVISPEGEVLFRSQPRPLRRMIRSETAAELVEMMKHTTISGTSSKQFRRGRYPVFPDLSIAAKTGTLRGDNPQGLNTWFIAAAPAEKPRYALSVIVVDPQTGSSRASYVGRKIFEKLFPQS